MSKSIVYCSHTEYDVNRSYDAVKCDIWSPKNYAIGEVNID